MSNMSDIKKYLELLDKNNTYLEEYEIASKIRELAGKEQLIGEDLLEFLAFSYFAESADKKSDWDMYYGPELLGTKADGSIHEFPARESVTEEALNYYKKRADEVNNLSLKYRYSNLVVDFQQKLRIKIDVKYFQSTIDALIELIEKSDLEGIVLIQKLSRAVSLTKTINDLKRLEKLKKASIKLEKKVAEDDKPGLWGFTLGHFQIKGKQLTEDELKDQLDIINHRLERLLKNKQVWPAQCVVELLLQYYSQPPKDCKKILELIKKLYNVYSTNETSNDHPLKVLHYLEEIKNIASNHTDCEEVKKFVEKVQNDINEYDANWEKHLKEVSVKLNIDNKKIEEWIKSIFGAQNQNELNVIFQKVAIHFIQKLDRVNTQLTDLQKKYPFQYLATRRIIGNGGQVIAESSKTEQFDFIQLYSQNLRVQDYFLNIVVNELTKRFTEEEMRAELLKCFLIDTKNHTYIERITKNLYNGNHIEVTALTVPLIEKLIRRLCKLNHENIFQPDETFGGYKYTNLHKLLNSESLKYVFGPLGGEDVVAYLKNTLTIKIGLNLRNDFCHGDNLDQLNAYTAYRLIHILILISLIRKNGERTNKNNI